MNKFGIFVGLLAATSLVGCATPADAPSYPAFVISDELPDIFLATLPGVRAKEYASDMRTRSSSNRIDLPEGWDGTTGGAPGKALEVFVISGELSVADVALNAGGYAYVPPGSLGFNMKTDEGARILYFLSDPDANAQIRTAIILNSDLIEWQPTDTVGVFTKDLRLDLGSGEHIWLTRYETDAQIPWQASSAALEGYLVSGQFMDSECVAGKPYTDLYKAGGYFRRPEKAVHGGPEAVAVEEALWFLRKRRASTINYDVGCSTE